MCTDGAGVSVVVGRAGTGKTFTMDAVRTAYETANLVLPPQQRVSVRGLAPTGIAALELSVGAGIETATVDRFLLDLANGRDRLQAGDVVIVDEANMLGTRKFARLFAHATQARAKLVAVGDDRQLQSIDAGGWYRGLRLRLGAAELTVNRRQLDELDRRAVELIRHGCAEQAMALYRDGGRVTVAKTAVEAHEAMVTDWWQAFAAGEHAVMLAHRRVEVDRLNDLGHAAMAAAGLLTGPALANQGRQFRVGDRVVCGVNRLRQLEVVNGTRAQVTAVDLDTHTVTIATDADREVTLPASYLRTELPSGRRPLDHAYAITGHKAEGVTVDRAFVRGGGHADQEWAYTAMTRVRQDARLYLVEGPTAPEAAEEVDLAPPRSQDPYDLAVATLGRSNPQRMALDAERETARPHPSTLSTRQLREERDRLAEVLAGRPRVQALAFRRTSTELANVEQRLAVTVAERAERAELADWLASHGRGLARLARRSEVAAAQAERGRLGLLEQQLQGRVEELAARERGLRRAEQQRAVWDEAHTHDLNRTRAVATELAWRTRARSKAHQVDPPAWLDRVLGPVPDSRRGQRAWRQAAEQTAAYRDRHGITDELDPLGPQPGDLTQRRAWRACQQTIDRVHSRNRERDAGRDLAIS